MALDVKSIAALKPRGAPYRVSDGKGLLLLVKPSGAKMWIARITVDGKRRDMGLGGYPTVSLKEARDRAAAAKKAAEAGTDPIRQRSAEAKARQAERESEVAAEARTFRAVAAVCIKAEAPGWKSSRTEKLWTASLKRHIYPTLGDVPIAEIDRAKVRQAIEGVWTSAPSVARKVLQHTSTILRYAAAHGWRANDNPADAKMLRFTGLPPLRGKKKQPSMPWARMPAFMAALDKMPGLAPLALRFAALTALRSGEVRQARWSWVSFDGVPTLTVPGEVMKGKKSADVRAHRVPLAPAALDVLARAYSQAVGTSAKVGELPALSTLRGDTLIFPSMKPGVPLSDMALSAVLRRMNSDRPEGLPAPWRDPDGREAVPHGLRSSFSTWVDDTRPQEREAAERALAHQVANAVSAAYRRSDLFDRRIPLMRDWADHCIGAVAPSAQRSAQS
jgi:integrase